MAIEGMGPLFKSGNIEHFVMETRKNQAPLVKTFYDYGKQALHYATSRMTLTDCVILRRAL
jgi:hypothetical protein